MHTSSRLGMQVLRHPPRRFPKTRFEPQKKQFERRSLREGDPSAHGSLVSELEAGIGLKKESWPMPLLRVLSDVLLEVADGRKLSAPHEARWLNLLGLLLASGVWRRAGQPAHEFNAQVVSIGTGVSR